ncbi:class I SAM-dependent methyltransferase [Actinotalea ferrariae]|nr:class I SAM-dependent methyltransferase [Actinotalea ferrariae]
MRTGYRLAYRLGFTPWESYGRIASSSVGALLDRETADRPSDGAPGRALDLGCGRGQKAEELVRRGWEVVGVDVVPAAVDAARELGLPDATFVVGDVTDLGSLDLGWFDLVLDIGCFQHLDARQRVATGDGVSALARPGATLLMLEFQATRLRSLVGGVTRTEVEAAFPGWRMLSVEPAPTAGLGWPMSTTAPQWYRLRRDR